jgi:phage terminase large subunit
VSAAVFMSEWIDDPVRFVREALRVEEIDAWQVEVLNAVAKHQRVALKASKGPGKSTVLSWIGWWWLGTRLHPKVVATSISGDNLRDGLWTEFSKWQQRSEFLKKAFTWQAERIVSNTSPETWWASARQWSKSADASQQSDTLAGVHADSVLFLIDEAGGIPDAVVATAEAGLANADPVRGTEAKLILSGNPTHTTGPLFRACTRERPLWWVKEINGDPDDPGRAPRVSKQWAREQIEKYGRDNPWVLVNVFGQFPPGQSNTLIGIEMATAATRLDLVPRDIAEEPKVVGVDVARFGDDRTVICMRQGRVAFKPRVFRNLDTMEVASQVALFIDKHKPDATFVDLGAFGIGVYDRLRQLKCDVIGVNFGDKALNGKFANRRSEMWFGLAQWLKRASIPDDAELLQELTGPTYKFTEDGSLILEKKAELKKRIQVSPDKADALALTFAAPVAPKGLRDFAAQRQPERDPHPLEGI